MLIDGGRFNLFCYLLLTIKIGMKVFGNSPCGAKMLITSLIERLVARRKGERVEGEESNCFYVSPPAQIGNRASLPFTFLLSFSLSPYFSHKRPNLNGQDTYHYFCLCAFSALVTGLFLDRNRANFLRDKSIVSTIRKESRTLTPRPPRFRHLGPHVYRRSEIPS